MITMSNIRITFGMIVLNGEPLIRYNLRSLYPYAHQIIVVEGACPGARNIATPDGHSVDGTLEILRKFQKEEDPENKITIVTAEDESHPDGFWTGEKDEMSQAYAKRATGNYLWQVDSDEFYLEKDMDTIIDMLANDPEITAASFKQITFFGSLDYLVDGYYLKSGADIYHRLFKWGEGYTYTGHRPPTVTNQDGVNLREIKHLTADMLLKKGVRMFHYSLLFPKQVSDKCDYYATANWSGRSDAKKWAEDMSSGLKRPFRVHNVYDFVSWLTHYQGEHPSQMNKLWNDIENGSIRVTLRNTKDIDSTINSPYYRFARSYLIAAFPLWTYLRRAVDKYHYTFDRKP